MIRELLELYVNSGFVKVELRGEDNITAEIPAVAAEKIKSGYELCEDFRISYEKLVEYQWLERRHDGVKPVPRDLYIRARLTIQESLAKGNEKNVKQIQAALRELIQLRLKKILSAVVMNPDLATSREFLEKLTYEEEILVRQIAQMVKDWMNYVLGLY